MLPVSSCVRAGTPTLNYLTLCTILPSRSLSFILGADLSRISMTPELLDLIAERFKALSDPVRLQILNALRTGEKSVTELIDETGRGQANVSKHLQLLHGLGFVTRRKEGLYVYYSLKSRDIFQLCDIMCGRIEKEVRARRRLLAS